jgi:hypothetical protein
MRASSREGKSMEVPHRGQEKRAFTGGIRSRPIEKLPEQLGQVKV